jgi:hypothetical protein
MDETYGYVTQPRAFGLAGFSIAQEVIPGAAV